MYPVLFYHERLGAGIQLTNTMPKAIPRALPIAGPGPVLILVLLPVSKLLEQWQRGIITES